MVDDLAQDIWKEALTRLRTQMSAAAYTMWLESTRGFSLSDDEIIVAVQTEYEQHWLQASLVPMMERAASEIRKRPVRVVLEVASEDAVTSVPSRAAAATKLDLTDDIPSAPRLTHAARSYVLGTRPDPQLTFDQFVVGDNTRLAYAAAAKVASESLRAYNPLVLYGPPGLGKTHLLHAIANEAPHHSLTTLLATAEQFVHDYVTSVQGKTTERFRSLYRSPDILIIDDVQFVCGKIKSEEALLHTCGALIGAGQQIVLSADRTPEALQFKNPRLAARLHAGLPVDIKPPDRRTRSNILAFKASRYGTEMPDDVLAYLAARRFTSVSQMEGDLTKVIAHATLLNEPLTLDLAQRALVPRPAGLDTAPITIDAIIRATAAYFDLKPATLIERSMDRSIMDARQLAMYLARHHTSASLAHIGESFGGRKKSAVTNGIQRVTERISTAPALQEAVTEILSLARTAKGSPRER